jgi:hypothetical protein
MLNVVASAIVALSTFKKIFVQFRLTVFNFVREKVSQF